MIAIDERTEWLEADGLGGFASGTTSGVRTRRYHALLLTATTPPTGRVVLVNGFDAWVDTPAGSFAISSQRYSPDVRHPDGATRVAGFDGEPWPTWQFALPDGTRLGQEIVSQHGTGVVVVRWTLTAAAGPATLRVRPFLSGRDYHSMHHENEVFAFEPERRGHVVVFRPYGGLPPISLASDGAYQHGPEWYRNFLYAEELARGLDAVEDLASPGEFVWSLEQGVSAPWILQAGDNGPIAPIRPVGADEIRALGASIQECERARRERFATPLDRAADAYLVRRRAGRTIVAGYPWFTDWGRDTFIAIRGLCLATNRLEEARDILLEWADAVSEGMLPNRFPDGHEEPEFNSVDASLWYVVAVGEFLARAERQSRLATPDTRARLVRAILQIVRGYAAGTRFGIRMDADGLLAAGAPGVQLTWMDAKVGDRVITPRIGKPIEIQALWFNAVLIARDLTGSGTGVPTPSNLPEQTLNLPEQIRRSVVERFWVEDGGYLADVVDVDHVPGTRDDTFRPNQILAVGGMPFALLSGDRARHVVDLVEGRLLTPLGLRSLAPDQPGYAPRYEGNGAARDAVYHQGTVWPWLIGPFVEGWLRTRRSTPSARREARLKFVDPLIAHIDNAGLGHVSEIVDAEAPFSPKGCPFQAWSLGELLRLDRQVLAVVTPKYRGVTKSRSPKAAAADGNPTKRTT